MTAVDAPPRPSHVRSRSRGAGVVSGVLAAATGVAVGEAAASLLRGLSPVEAVGLAVVDHTPAAPREWAIRNLGTADKPALILGVVVVLAVLAGIAGAVGTRRPRVALAATVALGAVAAVAATTTRTGADLGVVPRLLPSGVTLVVSALALAALLAAVRPRAEPSGEPYGLDDARRNTDGLAAAGREEPYGPYNSSPRSGIIPSAEHIAHRDEREVIDSSPPPSDGTGLDRRRFLATALAVGSVGAVGGVVARRAAAPLPVGAIPRVTDAAAALPAGADLRDVGMAPFHTPTNGFYRVDTALRIPRVDPVTWRLRVHGMVDRELVLDLDQLLARPMVERDITLTCVSNEVGGPYVGTARWIGARIADLLAECGVQAGADAVLSTAVDGFTVGTPLAELTDGRDALLAVAMNGEPLTPTHGFPVRMVVPGLYGYVSATKWLVDLEVTRFADFDAYWTTRGWAEQAPIKTSARIDHPRTGARINVGDVSIAGVAWAQHRGIQGVEVRVDDGPWLPAQLGTEATVDTWRQWRFDWDAPVGSHEISVRATDATGETQTPDRAPPAPDGATGWHSVVVGIFDGIPTGPPAGGGAPGPGPDDANLVR